MPQKPHEASTSHAKLIGRTSLKIIYHFERDSSTSRCGRQLTYSEIVKMKNIIELYES